MRSETVTYILYAACHRNRLNRAAATQQAF
jgi:hypothetical protein